VSEGRRIRLAFAVGTIFVTLIQPQLRADIITQIGGDTRNFTILYSGGGGRQLHHLAQGTIIGNIGVGGTGTVKADGSGAINGNVDFSASNTGQFSITPSKSLKVNYSQTDVTNDLTNISNFSSEDPDNVPTLNNLAYHLAGDKSAAEEALSLALRVKRLDPADPSVDDTIGWAYYNRGSYSLAVEYFEAAVARQPNARREYHLAMAYLKAGDARKARATLREGLKMDDNAPKASLAKKLIEPESRQ
jgi:hypothetical protein